MTVSDHRAGSRDGRHIKSGGIRYTAVRHTKDCDAQSGFCSKCLSIEAEK